MIFLSRRFLIDVVTNIGTTNKEKTPHRGAGSYVDDYCPVRTGSVRFVDNGGNDVLDPIRFERIKNNIPVAAGTKDSA